MGTEWKMKSFLEINSKENSSATPNVTTQTLLKDDFFLPIVWDLMMQSNSALCVNYWLKPLTLTLSELYRQWVKCVCVPMYLLYGIRCSKNTCKFCLHSNYPTSIEASWQPHFPDVDNFLFFFNEKQVF